MGSLEDYLELEWIEGREEERGDAEDEVLRDGDAGAVRLVLEHARAAWWPWHLPAHRRWAPPWGPPTPSADLFVACRGWLNKPRERTRARPMHAPAGGHPPPRSAAIVCLRADSQGGGLCAGGSAAATRGRCRAVAPGGRPLRSRRPPRPRRCRLPSPETPCRAAGGVQEQLLTAQRSRGQLPCRGLVPFFERERGSLRCGLGQACARRCCIPPFTCRRAPPLARSASLCACLAAGAPDSGVGWHGHVARLCVVLLLVWAWRHTQRGTCSGNWRLRGIPQSHLPCCLRRSPRPLSNVLRRVQKELKCGPVDTNARRREGRRREPCDRRVREKQGRQARIAGSENLV